MPLSLVVHSSRKFSVCFSDSPPKKSVAKQISSLSMSAWRRKFKNSIYFPKELTKQYLFFCTCPFPADYCFIDFSHHTHETCEFNNEFVFWFHSSDKTRDKIVFFWEIWTNSSGFLTFGEPTNSMCYLKTKYTSCLFRFDLFHLKCVSCLLLLNTIRRWNKANFFVLQFFKRKISTGGHFGERAEGTFQVLPHFPFVGYLCSFCWLTPLLLNATVKQAFLFAHSIWREKCKSSTLFQRSEQS